MTKKHISLLPILLTFLVTGCEQSDSEGECGDAKIDSEVIYNSELFLQPSEIYWGVTGNIRSYTYNWTFANNCTKSNPKVSFIASLHNGNNTLSNPFTITAATATCFGVQPRQAILVPDVDHKHYESPDSEIGMNQCFGGQSSATIYPYITISFTSLGSSQADSLYLVQQFYFVKATRVYNLPK